MIADNLRRPLLALAALALLFAHAGPASAEADKKGAKEREVARRMQQLQQEKSRLEQEKSDLAAKLQEAGTQEAETRRGLAGARREIAALKAKLEAAEASGRELKSKLEDTANRLSLRERERNMLESVANEQVQVIGRQSRLVETCNTRNVRLRQYGNELLGRFRADGAEGGEPLLGLGRVTAFDTYQEYRDKFDAQAAEAAPVSQ
jgi:septal ring factor EnvC (AmiA/AmiB activator)